MDSNCDGLLQKAIKRYGQAGTARRLGLSQATICLVSKGEYPASTTKVEAKIHEIFGDQEMEQIPAGYKRNAAGNLVPLENIKELDLARDEFVLDVVKGAERISALLADFKETLAGDIQAFLELSAERYGADMGGARGNLSLTSFDGRYRVMRCVADRLEFNEQLQAAKELVDQCLREWTRDSRSEIRALIDNAFQVDKKGKINTKRILGLRALKIDDPVWLRAMEAIGDALTVTGSCTYYRVYERDDRGEYQQIPLDFSGV